MRTAHEPARPFTASLLRRAARGPIGALVVVSASLSGAAAAGAPTGEDAPAIVLDGRFDDWSEADAVADGERVHVRIRLPEAITLQGGQFTTTLELDLDGKEETGRRPTEDRLTGADLEVVFSPPSPERGRGLRSGLQVRMIDDRSVITDVGHAAIGLAFAPTFAAAEAELRFDRATALPEPAGSRFRASTTLRGRLIVEGPDGAARGPAREFLVTLPPAVASSPDVEAIPSRPDGALRVLSWNVEWESPVKNPAPFSRLLAAVQPDVLLLQEWKSSDDELQAWFSAHAPSAAPWRAHTLPGLGVSVVARHPMVALTTEPVMPSREVAGKDPRPIRFVAARVDTPLGPLIAGSSHLKCCGSQGTWEDELRQVEAASINAFVRRQLVNTPDSSCVLTGDLNLVGTRIPLDALRETLDADGTNLDVVEAQVLGDPSSYTWTQDDGRFSPGRLDYAVFTDSRLRPAAAFVLDTVHLSDAALRRYGLERADSVASDHRPLVFDLVAAEAATAPEHR